MIFDRCHAASGTRADEYDPTLLVRSIELEEPLPPELDRDVWRTDSDLAPRGTAIAAGYGYTGLRSHVLLAACGSAEFAREQQGRGWFTKALLDVLYTVGADKLTYTDLMKRLPDLPGYVPYYYPCTLLIEMIVYIDKPLIARVITATAFSSMRKLQA